MLPIILYLDKTGTDVRQRFSREPPLFTTAALNRESRENRPFWRQLGFIPSSKNIEDSKGSLQLSWRHSQWVERGTTYPPVSSNQEFEWHNQNYEGTSTFDDYHG